MQDLPFPYSPIRHPNRLHAGEQIRLNGRAADGLRLRQVHNSEAFTIQDAGGDYFRASLIGLGGHGGEALVFEEMSHSPESPLRLQLFCAVLARQRMMFVAQKGTELGITRLFPLLTERSVAADGLEHEKAHAWPNQVLRAVRQCRRAAVPEVRPAAPLAESLEDPVWKTAEARYFLDDRAGRPADLPRGITSACLAVGPEGGWTDEERERLIRAGAQPLLLGGRILRAETAVLAGLLLLQYELGDLKSGPPGPGY